MDPVDLALCLAVDVSASVDFDEFGLMLGGYNPVPRHEWASLITQYIGIWDQLLAARFESDPRVAIVPP